MGPGGVKSRDSNNEDTCETTTLLPPQLILPERGRGP
jgi:hypothetical protein